MPIIIIYISGPLKLFIHTDETYRFLCRIFIFVCIPKLYCCESTKETLVLMLHGVTSQNVQNDKMVQNSE